MPKIILHSPIGVEASQTKDLVPLADPRGNNVAFLFNGHVSVVPFWRRLEAELKLRCEPGSTTTVVKPNTFAPASADDIKKLAQADIALVGVCP